MNSQCRMPLVSAVVLLCAAALVRGEVFDEKFEHWPLRVTSPGRVVVAGKLGDLAALESVVSPLAADTTVAVLLDKLMSPADSKPESNDASAGAESLEDKYRELFSEQNDSLDVLSLGEQPAQRITAALGDHEVVCWHSDADAAALAKYAESLAEPLRKFLAADRTLIVVGAASDWVGRFHLTSEAQPSTAAKGWNLIPDATLATGYSDQPVPRGRLLGVLANHPRSVGIGLADETALIFRGRKLRVTGAGSATFLLMANERQPLRVQTIARRQGRQRAPQYLVDWTEWRRDAIDRTLPAFPPAKPKTPFVENGTLVIVGGGGMPKGLMDRFVELAGGVAKAKLVYVPCSERERVSPDPYIVKAWKKMGVEHGTFIHTKDRDQANTDRDFLAPLKDATGIWFGGGRQWNFADSYYGTQAHQLMKQVVNRGGVVGGSSAGASIQARYLARATPIENFRIMAPGYERGGLGFISGVAIDQHFSQRGRQKDMTQLVNRYPQMLGIGIDEATALIVRESIGEVVGRGKVHFYDRNLPVYPDRPDYLAAGAGSRYDLANRKLLEPSDKEGSEEKTSEDAKEGN